MSEPDAWPQDDVKARATLLAWLEGEIDLERAAEVYAGCFPPAASVDVEHVKRTWAGWSVPLRRQMAAQIRRAMTAPPVS